MPGENANAQYRDSVFRAYFNAPARLQIGRAHV